MIGMHKSFISCTLEKKVKNRYVAESVNTSAPDIYKALAEDFISKKLLGSYSISRFTYRNLYNGFYNITVYHTNGYRTVYIIPSH